MTPRKGQSRWAERTIARFDRWNNLDFSLIGLFAPRNFHRWRLWQKLLVAAVFLAAMTLFGAVFGAPSPGPDGATRRPPARDEIYCSAPTQFTVSPSGRSHAYVQTCEPLDAKVHYRMKMNLAGQTAEASLRFDNSAMPLLLDDDPAMRWITARGGDNGLHLGALEVYERRGEAGGAVRIERVEAAPYDEMVQVVVGDGCALIVVSDHPADPMDTLYLYDRARGLTKVDAPFTGRVAFWDQGARAFVLRQWAPGQTSPQMADLGKNRFSAIDCAGAAQPSFALPALLPGDAVWDVRFYGAARAPRLLMTRETGETFEVFIHDTAKPGAPRLIASRKWKAFLDDAVISGDGRLVALMLDDGAVLLDADSLKELARDKTPPERVASIGVLNGALAVMTNEDGLKLIRPRRAAR